jgi:hypothetical protein
VIRQFLRVRLTNSRLNSKLASAFVGCPHGIDEVTPLAVRVPLDQWDVLELQIGHRHALFEGLLDLVFIRARLCDQAHAEATRPVLNDLQIPYLLPQDALLVAENVAKQ